MTKSHKPDRPKRPRLDQQNGGEDSGGRDGAEGHHGPELYQQQALHSQQRRREEALRQCGLAVQGKRSFG